MKLAPETPTVTPTRPCVCGGATAMAVLVVSTVVRKLRVLSKSTVRPGAKPRPVRVTVFPPAWGPVSGVSETRRGRSRYTKPPARVALGPPGSVTLTATGPGWNCGAGGTSMVSVVALVASTVACCAPRCTTSPVLKPVPLMTAVVVLSAKPNAGESEAMRGCCASVSAETVNVVSAGTTSGR